MKIRLQSLWTLLMLLPLAFSSVAADLKAKSVDNTAKRPVTTNAVKKRPGNIQRPAQAKTATNSANNSANNAAHHEVWFHRIDITLDDDINHNGYYSRITVNFDADTIYDPIDVYAVLKLTDPNGFINDYFVSDVFDLHGESANDYREIETVLTDNWLTDQYHLSVQLFDAHNDELLAHIDREHAPQLAFLALESLDYEYSAPQYLSMFDAQLNLLHDDDGDGYYHGFSLELDIDINYGSSEVYAELYVSTDQISWQPLLTSEPFNIVEDHTHDNQTWQFEWLGGYPTGHYTIKALIVDANHHQTLLEILPGQSPALRAIPLEDVTQEVVITPPPAPTPVRTSSSKESGGSLSWWVVGLLLLSFVRRTSTTLSLAK